MSDALKRRQREMADLARNLRMEPGQRLDRMAQVRFPQAYRNLKPSVGQAARIWRELEKAYPSMSHARAGMRSAPCAADYAILLIAGPTSSTASFIEPGSLLAGDPLRTTPPEERDAVLMELCRAVLDKAQLAAEGGLDEHQQSLAEGYLAGAARVLFGHPSYRLAELFQNFAGDGYVVALTVILTFQLDGLVVIPVPVGPANPSPPFDLSQENAALSRAMRSRQGSFDDAIAGIVADMQASVRAKGSDG